jgi:hypothetical protein
MKINDRRVQVALIAAVFVVSVASALFWWRAKPGVGQEHFDRLKSGMTRQEAESLLFGPPRNDLRHPAIIWLPQATGKRISARIAPESPAIEILLREDKPTNVRQEMRDATSLDFFPQASTKDGCQAVWITRTGLIALYFGHDGRLRHKYSSTVDEPTPPSVLDWLATRPSAILRSIGF